MTWTLEILQRTERGLAQRFRRPLSCPSSSVWGTLQRNAHLEETDGIELVRNGAVTRAVATGLEAPEEDLRVSLAATWTPRSPEFVLPPAVARYGLEAPTAAWASGSVAPWRRSQRAFRPWVSPSARSPRAGAPWATPGPWGVPRRAGGV